MATQPPRKRVKLPDFPDPLGIFSRGVTTKKGVAAKLRKISEEVYDWSSWETNAAIVKALQDLGESQIVTEFNAIANQGRDIRLRLDRLADRL